MRQWLLAAMALGALLPWSALASTAPVAFDVSQFTVVERRSGPVNYYTKMGAGEDAFIRAEYKPPTKTTVLGVEVPEALKREPRRLTWRWRALTLPNGGDECRDGKGDSAAVVYLMWKSGLCWYSLKYVWSAESRAGATCDSKRGLFVKQDTVVLRSGGPLGTWMTEEIDPTAEFRRHFRNGDPKGDVPDFVGIGIMSDGDQTKSESSADYAGFVLGP
jgi:hypothetical protein